jgi:hypothetical protein
LDPEERLGADIIQKVLLLFSFPAII